MPAGSSSVRTVRTRVVVAAALAGNRRRRKEKKIGLAQDIQNRTVLLSIRISQQSFELHGLLLLLVVVFVFPDNLQVLAPTIRSREFATDSSWAPQQCAKERTTFTWVSFGCLLCMIPVILTPVNFHLLLALFSSLLPSIHIFALSWVYVYVRVYIAAAERIGNKQIKYCKNSSTDQVQSPLSDTKNGAPLPLPVLSTTFRALLPSNRKRQNRTTLERRRGSWRKGIIVIAYSLTTTTASISSCSPLDHAQLARLQHANVFLSPPSPIILLCTAFAAATNDIPKHSCTSEAPTCDTDERGRGNERPPNKTTNEVPTDRPPRIKPYPSPFPVAS